LSAQSSVHNVKVERNFTHEADVQTVTHTNAEGAQRRHWRFTPKLSGVADIEEYLSRGGFASFTVQPRARLCFGGTDPPASSSEEF
jgi:hypothetical protein